MWASGHVGQGGVTRKMAPRVTRLGAPRAELLKLVSLGCTFALGAHGSECLPPNTAGVLMSAAAPAILSLAMDVGPQAVPRAVIDASSSQRNGARERKPWLEVLRDEVHRMTRRRGGRRRRALHTAPPV